jgi:hypothetical protein
MEIHVPPFKEKRQFGRIKIPEPTLCQVYFPKSRKIKGYRCVIKNISLGGIYFVCDENPPLEKDDIRHLIFNVIYNYRKIYRLKFHVVVVRTENKGSQFATALKFLSDPIYYPLDESNGSELPSLDKIRILYQNYQLYRKAYEIIKMTPEIRTEKIDNITKRLEHNLYQIDRITLAHSMTTDLTDKFNKLAKEFYRQILK